jgi:hypothetical protein
MYIYLPRSISTGLVAVLLEVNHFLGCQPPVQKGSDLDQVRDVSGFNTRDGIDEVSLGNEVSWLGVG